MDVGKHPTMDGLEWKILLNMHDLGGKPEF